MANTKSAKKMVRKIAQRTEVNKVRRSRMRSEVRNVEAAIEAGDRAAATSALRIAEPLLMRTAQQGVLHKNAASRKISRLSARIRSIAE
ncbi:MAG: 30S ribosomal protein S20 [Hyphomicrobiaceae bacterium]